VARSFDTVNAALKPRNLRNCEMEPAGIQ